MEDRRGQNHQKMDLDCGHTTHRHWGSYAICDPGKQYQQGKSRSGRNARPIVVAIIAHNGSTLQKGVSIMASNEYGYDRDYRKTYEGYGWYRELKKTINAGKSEQDKREPTFADHKQIYLRRRP